MNHDNIYGTDEKNLISSDSYVLSDDYSLKVMSYGEKRRNFINVF